MWALGVHEAHCGAVANLASRSNRAWTKKVAKYAAAKWRKGNNLQFLMVFPSLALTQAFGRAGMTWAGTSGAS